MTKYEIFSVVISLLSMVISILTACTEFRQKMCIYHMKFDAVVLPVEQYRTTSPSKFVELLSEECKVDFVSENIYKYCDRVFLTKQGKKKGVKIRLNRGE